MRSAQWAALGTDVHLLVADDAALPAAEQLLRADLDRLDLACSRFRPDSELRRLRPGRQRVSGVLAGAVRAALRAAEQTGGLVDPTLGRALRQAGYDRTFTRLPVDGPAVHGVHVPRWREIACAGGVLDLPADVELDLGATAKAWAADEAARRIARRTGSAVLVNLGGDLAAVGAWDVDAAGHPVTLDGGGLATSSTRSRTWRRGGRELHHVLDPRTAAPADPVWATVTVAAASCLDANTASTAALVLGAEAPEWLADRGLPSRLVTRNGSVVRTAGWPEQRAA